jgi:hypothetical protein
VLRLHPSMREEMWRVGWTLVVARSPIDAMPRHFNLEPRGARPSVCQSSRSSAGEKAGPAMTPNDPPIRRRTESRFVFSRNRGSASQKDQQKTASRLGINSYLSPHPSSPHSKQNPFNNSTSFRQTEAHNLATHTQNSDQCSKRIRHEIRNIWPS